MADQGTSTNIDKTLQISGSLVSILSKGFGPVGASTLLSTATGRVMVTKDGSTILGALHLDHPIANFIKKCAIKHHTYSGDGCKSFIILLHEALRLLAKHDENQNSYLWIKQGMLDFEHSSIMKLFLHDITNNCIVTPILESNVANIKQNIEATIQCVMINHISSKMAANVFVNLLMKFIFDSVNNIRDLKSCLDLFINNFPLLFHKSPGANVIKSDTSEGVLLDRDCSIPCSKSSDLNCVVLKCSFDEIDNQNATVSVDSNDSFLNILNWKSQHIKTVIEYYKSKEVDLILTTSKCSDLVKSVCRTNNIGLIQFLEDDEADWICTCCVISPITDVIDELYPINICALKSIEQFYKNNRKCVILHPLLYSGAKIKPNFVSVSGVTEGSCDVYYFALLNALKSLRIWLSCGHRSIFLGDTDFTLQNCDFGVSIPSNNFYEFLVHQFLKQFKDKPFLMFLANIYMIIPRTVFNNSFATTRVFLDTSTKIMASFSSNEFRILNPRTGDPSSLNHDNLEPLGEKIMLFNAVTDCLMQIIRIDSIN